MTRKQVKYLLLICADPSVEGSADESRDMIKTIRAMTKTEAI